MDILKQDNTEIELQKIKRNSTDTVININNSPINNNLQNLVIDMANTNNWNDQNETTLRNWKTSLVQSIFIYQFILDKTQIRFNRILFCIEILGGLSSLISTISATILAVNKGLNSPTTYNTTSLASRLN